MSTFCHVLFPKLRTQKWAKKLFRIEAYRERFCCVRATRIDAVKFEYKLFLKFLITSIGFWSHNMSLT